MNAVVALCHFCELHGPVIVMYTQPNNNKHSIGQNQVQVIDKTSGDEVKNYISNNKLYHIFERANKNSNLPKATCPSCTSLGKDGLHLTSNDHDDHITYMSSQVPEDQSLYTLLRHVCIRSLTCEITPGEDGAIYFGEESNTHVISYKFKMDNAMARGNRSVYSIVIVSKDKLALLNLWPFLVKNVKVLVNQLQTAAHNVFCEEQATEIARTVRVGNPELHPALNHRSRAGDIEPRSFISLTRMENVYESLHTWFTWLLRVGGSTYQNWQPNFHDSSYSEDSLLYHNDLEIVSDLEIQTSHLSQLYGLLGRAQFALLAFHVIVGNQLIVRCANQSLAVALTRAVSMMLPRGCARLGTSGTEYKPLFQCNLLALDITVPLSHEVTDVDADSCVVLLVSPSTSSDGANSDNNIMASSSVAGCNSSTSDHAATANADGNCGGSNTLTLTADQLKMDSSKPPIIGPITSLASANANCPPRLVKQFIDILEKASEISLKMLTMTIEIVISEWTNKTELYYAYKRKQTGYHLSDMEYEQRLNAFLKAIGVNNVADHAVLRFWVQGLSEETKRSIKYGAIKSD